jgi:hypothetical protein
MRFGVLILAAAALSACSYLDNAFPGFERASRARQPIRLAESKVSFVGDRDPIVSREAISYKDRYTEWLVAENGVKLRYSRLTKGALNPRVSVDDALKADAKVDYFDDENIAFDSANVQRRGAVAYLFGRSRTTSCLIFRSHFGDTAGGPASSQGNQEFIGQDCRPTVQNVAETLRSEVFAVVDRARFDDGEINRSRAAAPVSAPPAVAAPAPPPPQAQPTPPPAFSAPAAPPQPTLSVPTAPPPAPPPAALPRSTADRLRTLRDLLDQKLISPKEYEQRRKAILDSI